MGVKKIGSGLGSLSQIKASFYVMFGGDSEPTQKVEFGFPIPSCHLFTTQAIPIKQNSEEVKKNA